jgi:hypothetical protein
MNNNIFSSSLPLAENDILKFSLYSYGSAVTFYISASILVDTGDIQYYEESVDIAAGAYDTSYEFNLPNGYLISAACTVGSSATLGNPCYCNCYVQTPSPSTSFIKYQLFSGFVKANSPLGFPARSDNSSFSDIHNNFIINPTNPAVGADLVYTNPSSYDLHITNIRLQQNTDASVGNRYLQVYAKLALAADMGWQFTTTAIPASSTVIQSFSIGGEHAVVDVYYSNPLPAALVVPPNKSLNITHYNGTATDHLAGIYITANALFSGN